MTPDRSLFLSPLDPADEAPTGDPVPAQADPAPGGGGVVPPAVGGGGEGRRRAGVVALLLLLAVGAVAANRVAATGDGGGAEEGATTATTERRRTTTTRRPDRAPTTTLPATLRTVAVQGRLLPEPTGTSVVLASHSRLVVVHLDTGTVRTVDVERMEVYGSYPFLPVLSTGDALLTTGDVPKLVSRTPGLAVEPAEVPVYGGYLPSAVEGRWWTIDQRFSTELVERGPDGPTGRRVSVPAESGAILPVGDTFIVSPHGSVMQVGASTGRGVRIADGTAVASDGRTLARVRCDEALECGLVLSDLQGGDERSIPPPSARSRYDTYSGARFSPDGRWLALPFYGEDQPGGTALVDVAAGEQRQYDSLTASSAGGFPQSAAFTADSRWLLLADLSADGRPIKAIRLEDGTAVEIDLDLERRGGGEGFTLLAVPALPVDAEPGG